MTIQELFDHVVVKEAMIPRYYRLNDYLEYLHTGGWEEIGSGSYGVVLEKKGKNYVLKVYTDRGYDTFLQYVESHSDNPHLVKVKRHIISENSPNFLGVVAIEKLNPIRNRNGKYDWVNRITIEFADYLTRYRGNSFDETIDHFRDFYIEEYKNSNRKEMKQGIRRLDFFIENYLPIARTLYDISFYINEDVFMDLHLGNFMIRPSTNEIVITDPLA